MDLKSDWSPLDSDLGSGSSAPVQQQSKAVAPKNAAPKSGSQSALPSKPAPPSKEDFGRKK